MTTTTNGTEPSVPDVTVVGSESDTCDNETVEAAHDSTAAVKTQQPRPKRLRTKVILAYGVLPALALLLAAGAGFLKYQAESVRQSQAAAVESVQAASDGTIALLSYQPDTADKQLPAARERLTRDVPRRVHQAHNRCRHPRLEAEKDLRRSDGTGGGVSVGHAKQCGSAAIHRSERRDRDRCAYRHVVDRASNPSERRDRWLISQFDPL